MFSNCFLGAPCGLQRLTCENEALSAKVLEQVTNSQELVTLNKFEQQSSEYQLRKCLEERIADLESWRWVLQDLSNRLDELIEALRYEHKALRVVVQRIEEEIDRQSKERSRPGALSPQTDAVEDAIKEEHKFLQEQKKKFEKMIDDLNEQIPKIEKIKKRIEVDASRKQQTIHLEEKLSDMEIGFTNPRKGKKKSSSPLARWERQCHSLKRKGLCALSHALSIRQQVRGCRSLLSVVAQSYAGRVDSLLKRRLHLNTRKLEDLRWQKGEAQQDFKFLSDELTSTEQNILETMDKIRLMEARLADRRLRPPRELTRDNVDRKLRDELSRLRQYLKCLRDNIDRTTSLQSDLTASIAQMNCVEDDLIQIIQLDTDRIMHRTYDDSSGQATSASFGSSTGADRPDTVHDTPNESKSSGVGEVILLTTIVEENEDEEEDDYPFDF